MPAPFIVTPPLYKKKDPLGAFLKPKGVIAESKHVSRDTQFLNKTRNSLRTAAAHPPLSKNIFVDGNRTRSEDDDSCYVDFLWSRYSRRIALIRTIFLVSAFPARFPPSRFPTCGRFLSGHVFPRFSETTPHNVSTKNKSLAKQLPPGLMILVQAATLVFWWRRGESNPGPTGASHGGGYRLILRFNVEPSLPKAG